ncbi:hypothetical protein [Gramella sp. MAR_2010_147]|uniref:hypothetical protein n=1 Tax=Gramella sp. MAR_2010_147 TaxID=1250205 RepID=UPI00087AD1EE|nr:hypothetical protein [Gramella sp. MAR_2010_147]SDS05983.1 hypothetical protein SAMN04488553_1373 [Gramella sp. MAR_2010_147]
MSFNFQVLYSSLTLLLFGGLLSGIFQALNLKVFGDKLSGYYLNILDQSVKQFDLLHTFLEIVNLEEKQIDYLTKLKLPDIKKARIELIAPLRDHEGCTVSFLAKANTLLPLELFQMSYDERIRFKEMCSSL